MAKKKINHPDLSSWENLNDALRDADEVFCKKLLKLEQEGRRRKQFLLRIHSRLNKVRADAERAELLQCDT
jgi:hypothetical protein